MTKMLASGECSAAAFARSRTMEALVLNKSGCQLVVKLQTTQTWHTVTGHSGLARNTSGDDDNLSALESLGET